MKVESLVDFIRDVRQFAEIGDTLKCYRGQRDKAWENVPGLLRSDRKGLEINEKRATRDLMSVHPSEFESDQTMFDRLVRMQHFGLPTRLLDVSLNPLVALYFATDPGPIGSPTDGVVIAFNVTSDREKYYDSDTVSCIANLANLEKNEKNEIIEIRCERLQTENREDEIKRSNSEEVYKKLHQFIRAEKPYFLPFIYPIDLFKPFYVHPKMSNRRILAQAGGFIIYGLKPKRDIRFQGKIDERRFIVPQKLKAIIRRHLQLLGITDSTLFPEIDRAAKRISEKYSQSS
jgi:FRG domain